MKFGLIFLLVFSYLTYAALENEDLKNQEQSFSDHALNLDESESIEDASVLRRWHFFGCFRHRRYCLRSAYEFGYYEVTAGLEERNCGRRQPWACYVRY